MSDHKTQNMTVFGYDSELIQICRHFGICSGFCRLFDVAPILNFTFRWKLQFRCKMQQVWNSLELFVVSAVKDSNSLNLPQDKGNEGTDD